MSKKNSKNSAKKIRLEHLVIENFKALDRLVIDFPPPLMEDDPDIFIMGSKNGLGKTSFLEASFLLFLTAITGQESFILKPYSDADLARFVDVPVDISDLIVRAGSQEAQIRGSFVIGEKPVGVNLRLRRGGRVAVEGDRENLEWLSKQLDKSVTYSPREMTTRFSHILAGLNSDPLILPPFMYFHSYRKVQEGNLELGMMVQTDRPRQYRSRLGYNIAISTFKLEVLRSLMSRGGLFENLDDAEADVVLNKLNDLMKEYAGGYIEKLRPSPDNTIEFRITPTNRGPSFTFDGLSSGQKEIISTLFLIWRYTQNQPGIVLIDEPELHLNPEWHRSFIRNLHKLAPDNQYLIATHSEDIFAAVDKDRRILFDVSVG